jgi:type VI protein secretion system component Hcp
MKAITDPMQVTTGRRILQFPFAVVLMAGLFAVAPHPALAAQKVFLSFEGTTQGVVKGESKDKDHVGWIDVQSANLAGMEVSDENDVAIRRLAGSGMPSGKRQHIPVVLYRAVDSSSPNLWQAASSGETIRQITVECCSGKHIQRITITGGTIALKLVRPGVESVTITGGTVAYD